MQLPIVISKWGLPICPCIKTPKMNILILWAKFYFYLYYYLDMYIGQLTFNIRQLSLPFAICNSKLNKSYILVSISNTKALIFHTRFVHFFCFLVAIKKQTFYCCQYKKCTSNIVITMVFKSLSLTSNCTTRIKTVFT